MTGHPLPLGGRRVVRLMGALSCVMQFFSPLAAAAPVAPKDRPTALAEIRALNGAMPSSFDLYPSDPCAGTWDVELPSGERVMKVTVFRYRNLPLMHVSGPGFEPSHHAFTRVDPHSIRAAGVDIALRCANDRAIAELKVAGRDQPMMLNARPGSLDVPKAPAAGGGSHAFVREQHGNIEYVDAKGAVHPIVQGGNYSEPVLSPDGRTIAFIHLDGKPTEEGESGFTSLWITDAVTGEMRRLLASKPDNDEPKRDLGSFGNPRFSLGGGFVYVDAVAWMTSRAVHQVSVKTGAERFVIDGWVKAIIRTGLYRGYLLVSRHMHHEPLGSGSYDPVYVVRPDGNAELMVPGSDEDDGEQSVPAWLRANGWTAW